MAPGEPIGRRRDSEFTAAEPEIAIVLGSTGAILGYTLANDVSAWDIERDNPLYLPQSKVYNGCFAFGPVIVTPDEIPDPYALALRCRVTRGGREVFAGEASTGQLKRRFEEIVAWLLRSNEIRTGTVLSTGTGIIQPIGLRARGGRRGHALVARARRAPEPRGARLTPDPYALRPEDVEEPPATRCLALWRLGPGMVLAASIVGSGELIVTTTLGAQAGYAALWIVLLSCAVKPVVQAELGRYTIASGETGLEALDRVPGPRLGVSWMLWAWALTVFMSLVQVGGMFGGVAQVMNLLLPAVPAPAWVLVLVALTLALLLGGGYERVERLALVKVGLFTLLTVLAALVLTRKPEQFSWGRVASGLRFRLPGNGLRHGGRRLRHHRRGRHRALHVPLLVRREGLRALRGAERGSASRVARARGWIRLMHVDILRRWSSTRSPRWPSTCSARACSRWAGARGRGHDPDAVEHLHPDPRPLGAAALLSRRHDHPLRHDLRGDRRPLAGLRRPLPAAGPLRRATTTRRASSAAAASRCC